MNLKTYYQKRCQETFEPVSYQNKLFKKKYKKCSFFSTSAFVIGIIGFFSSAAKSHLNLILVSLCIMAISLGYTGFIENKNKKIEKEMEASIISKDRWIIDNSQNEEDIYFFKMFHLIVQIHHLENHLEINNIEHLVNYLDIEELLSSIKNKNYSFSSVIFKKDYKKLFDSENPSEHILYKKLIKYENYSLDELEKEYIKLLKMKQKKAYAKLKETVEEFELIEKNLFNTKPLTLSL